MFIVNSDKKHWDAILNGIMFVINFCNSIKMNCALMFIISIHYRRKWLNLLFQLERSNVIFKVISDIMAHWYALLNSIIIVINFRNAIKMRCELMFIISNHHGSKCLTNVFHLELFGVCLKWFQTKWRIGIQWTELYLQSISAMHINVIVHWCLS